jgi:hypothetical protein
MNDSKEIEEMSLVRFESNDYVKNNTSEYLSQIIQENQHLPVHIQDQNMDN